MRRALLGVCTVLLCAASSMFGQNSGAIGGIITDQTGALVPNAQITVTNPDTNVPAKTTSLNDGKYLFNDLAPGPYEMKVEVPGFKTYSSKGIVLHVSDKLTVNVSLEVGESRETVSVVEDAPLLRTEDAQMGEVINNNFISNMPQLNRNPFALLSLSGDVAGSTTVNSSQQNSIQVNGGRTSAVDYYVDGAVVNTGQSNALANQTPSMDAVAEFKVVTSGISAEYGRISGGYITLVTKAGTNSYHGSLYEYMFNDMFNANAWDQNALGNKKVHFRQNDYGFTLGGPVRIPKVYNGKNRTFFFVDNEYLKKNQAGAIVVNSVPNDAERAGDLSKTLYQGKQYVAYDPFGPQVFNTSNGLWQRTGLLGGDGMHVPASLISPVSTAILKMIPEPNRPSVAGSSSLNNYGFASGNSLYNFRLGERLDHTITNNQRLSISFRSFDTNQSAGATMDTPLYTNNQIASASGTLTPTLHSNGGLSGSVNYTWVARPTLIFELRNSITHNPLLTGAAHPSSFNNSFLPSIYKQYIGTNDVPNISVTFMSGTPYGQRAATAITNSTTYAFAPTVTKILDKHTLKFGVEYRRYYDNFVNIAGSNTMNFMVDPLYQFQGDWGLGAIQGRVLGLESFLLGINDQNNIAKPTTRAMNTNYWGTFIQDDWKVTQKLTVNIGLRWDDERPTTERHNNLYFWDPSYPSLFSVNPGYSFSAALAAAGLPANAPVPAWVTSGSFQPGAVMIAGSPQFPSRTPQQVDNHNLAPRVGLAYQVDKNTVIRAFGGKMYLPTTGNPSSYATANSNVALSDQAFAGWHASTDGGRTYISTWANPFPLPAMFSTGPVRDVKTVNLQSSLDPGASAVSQTLNMPREYDWSFDIQRQLPLKLLAEFGYNGNRGLGLIATDTISHYPASLLQPQYAAMMQGFMLSPNAGQTLETTITGTTQQLGLLEYTYPYYGRVQVSGINEGRSTYNAFTSRVERRLSDGFSALLNYTYSKLMDDVGGPDGQGGKTVQSIDSFRKAWGLSPLDHTHRLNIAFTYEFPFGRGRHWMRNPSGFGGKALDYAVGGWQLAGNWSYTNGNPVILTGSTTSNINNTIKVNQSWGSYATSDHNLTSANYHSDLQVLYSPIDPITTSSVRRLDPTKVVGAQAFISGNLPPTDGNYRNPPFYQMDLSLMKNFPVRENWYFQIRAEAQNAFNYRGFGNYNVSIGTANYGLITTAGNTPRQIQLSARFNF